LKKYGLSKHHRGGNHFSGIIIRRADNLAQGESVLVKIFVRRRMRLRERYETKNIRCEKFFRAAECFGFLLIA